MFTDQPANLDPLPYCNALMINISITQVKSDGIPMAYNKLLINNMIKIRVIRIQSRNFY